MQACREVEFSRTLYMHRLRTILMVKTSQFTSKCKGARPSHSCKMANITLVGLHLDLEFWPT